MASLLANRFASMAEQGLRDIKFDIDVGAARLLPEPVETVTSEVGALYAAVDAGMEDELDFKDSNT